MNVKLLILILVCWWLHTCVPKESVPKVEAVFPSADTLPENLLRMYIQFATPMKTTGNIEKIKLLNEQGDEVQAFFNNVHELWDEHQTQLTLILDPARVKSGLLANKQYGRALKPGSTYRLILAGLEDVHHLKMNQDYVKEFFISPIDTISPEPKNWVLTIPKAKTSQPLEIRFQETLDRISAQQRIVLMDKEAHRLYGRVKLAEDEMKWIFTPHKEWSEDHYTIAIHTRLSDPCGNNLNGLFDHQSGSLKYASEDEVVKLSFAVTP